MNAFIICNFVLAVGCAFFAGDCLRAHRGPRVFGTWHSELPHFYIFAGGALFCSGALAVAWIVGLGRAVS